MKIHAIAQKREKLVKEGSIKFQAPLDFENIKNTGFSTPTKSGTIFIDWNISVIDAGFLVQIQDVTKVKKSEESLKESEKYRRWFDEDLTGDFIATPEGKVIECNPHLQRYMALITLKRLFKQTFLSSTLMIGKI